MKLGGYAHYNGITFFSDVLKVKVVKNKEKFQYDLEWILPNKWLNRLDGKFILGGFLVMYYQWKVLNNKHKIIMSGLVLLLILEEIFHMPSIDFLSILPFSPYWLFGAGFVIVLLNIKKIIRLFQYHGAEHKVINCYAEHGYVNRYLVKRASRFNTRCGSNLGLILILLYTILWLLNIDSVLWFFVIFLIALQIAKKIASLDKKWDKYTNILQWITVLEPKDEDIDLAIDAFKYLLKSYEIYRKESSSSQ